ncbi:histidine phosphatase family protein [Oceanobacillus piezotolerans]|uniref:Histidine phosphatase family protein n=1 Tax=Oceanobacillus piezotolerans TaxID=2448030 RepID=A0A498DAG1_9BACI|nr:histidine phosphatase family protein [Oceanobacillus piezotolerans]RLL48323.1 histidine phosphatase family protein [Oceanobacillus piezotolerans]
MKTFIYMVRHGDSPKEGSERTRELTEKGYIDAQLITKRLTEEGVDAVISSPYKRSILTVQELANQIGQEVLVYEDLKERIFTRENIRIADKELLPIVEKSFSVPDFKLPGGESNVECQARAINILKEVLKTYQGKKVVIGTHGVVMTLLMGYYDRKFGLEFLLQTSKPDIYKMEYYGEELVEVKRLWESTI